MSKIRKMLSLMLAVLLAVIVTVMPTAQVIAKAQAAESSSTDSASAGKYISEVRVGLGKSKDAAAKSLEGYTILKNDNGEYADLNEGAGSNSIIGSKGDKVVLLGYKTTDDPADAITDLAVMNMDGGYSVRDYEALMDVYFDSQIRPFITGFMAAIQEYRENYKSANPVNREKARYAHDMLNKLYDDDTNSYLGDLLLRKTRQEYTDDEYNKLHDKEKKYVGDLETILCQSNGQASLTMENLLTRASDTADDTWIERFVEMDYDTLVNEYFPDALPSDAEAMMTNIFGDTAMLIVSKWDKLLDDLEGYDEAVKFLDRFDYDELDRINAEIAAYDEKTATEEQAAQVAEDILTSRTMTLDLATNLETAALYDYLEATEYFDGFTMLDFFTMSSDEAEDNITLIYPMVAALSPGQRAGLEFVSLRELILMSATDADSYADMSRLQSAEPASIYENVDRGIYEKGGVALTSDALRKRALVNDTEYNPLSTLTQVMYGATIVSAVALVTTLSVKGVFKIRANIFSNLKNEASIPRVPEGCRYARVDIGQVNEYATKMENMESASAACNKYLIGFSIALVIITAISVYLTYTELCEYYDVEFSPIPNYMVDEADITRKKENGETYVIKNQTAYYKAVLCNRTESDEKYSEIGDKADLNGDVGRKWVALYSVKNAAQYPILADSFKVVYGSSNVPLEYSNSIHKFGSGAAFDLNNTYYAWNHGKGGIYVYYKVDDTVPPRPNAVVGTIQSGGTLAAVGGGGLLVGILAGSLLTNMRGKKKEAENTEEAA